MFNFRRALQFLFPSEKVSRLKYILLGVVLPLGTLLFSFRAYADYIMFGDDIDGPIYYLFHYFEKPWVPEHLSGWEAAPLVLNPSFFYVQIFAVFLLILVLINFSVYTTLRARTVIRNFPKGSVSFIFALMVQPYALIAFIFLLLVSPDNIYQIEKQSRMRNYLLFVCGIVVFTITLTLSDNGSMIINDINKALESRAN